MTDGSAEPGQPDIDVDAEKQGLVLSLAKRITSLTDDDEDVEIEDPDLAHRLALSVKPYIDRLVSLRLLLNPVGRIIEKREKMEDLRGGIADDIASVEDASQELGEVIDVSLMTELQTELAAVKRDRKLFTDDDEDEEEDGLPEVEDVPEIQDTDKRLGRTAFLDRPVADQIISQAIISNALENDSESVVAFLNGGIQTQFHLGNATGSPLCFDTMNGTIPKLGHLIDTVRPVSGSSPSSLETDNAWAAKASLASKISMSSILTPVFSNSLRTAGTGPMPIIEGSTPARA